MTRRSVRPVHLLTGVALLAVLGWLVWRGVYGSGRRLDLRETFATRLGDTLGIGGAAGGPGHRLVVWTEGRARLALFERGTRRTLEPAGLTQPVAAAFVGNDGALEVLDGPRGILLALGGDGMVHRSRRVAALAGAVMGARASGGWYAVVPDSTQTRHTLWFVADAEAPRRLKEFRRPRPQQLPDLRLSATGTEVLVTQANAPFAALRITPDGRTTHIAGGFERLSRADSSAARVADALWVSLPMLPIGRRYLQTLVNLRGDRRVLLTFAARGGGTARQRVIDAPVTFFATVPGSHTLLALRQLGEPEIVEYTWND